jgi:hypothetical protein
LKSLFICLIVFFFLLGIPWFFDAIDNARTDDYQLSFAGVTTGAGEYTSNVTLTSSLYYGAVAFVSEISSNLTSYDTPSAASYNTVSHLLTVNGLGESAARTLVIDYKIPSVSLPDFMPVILVAFRWLYIFVILGLEGSAMYAFFHT